MRKIGVGISRAQATMRAATADCSSRSIKQPYSGWKALVVSYGIAR
jgi:hypothetical protein